MLQHQSKVRAISDADGFDIGECRTRSGGGKTSESVTDRPGGMAPPEVFVGTYEHEEATVERALSHGVDSGLLQKMNARHGEVFTITEQPVDDRGRPGFHRPNVYKGKLTGSAESDMDANGNERKVLTLTFAVYLIA